MRFYVFRCPHERKRRDLSITELRAIKGYGSTLGLIQFCSFFLRRSSPKISSPRHAKPFTLHKAARKRLAFRVKSPSLHDDKHAHLCSLKYFLLFFSIVSSLQYSAVLGFLSCMDSFPLCIPAFERETCLKPSF